MALTGLNIKLDREEYSRFEPARSTVRARILPTPADNLAGEQITVSLRRENGILMQEIAVTLNGAKPKGEIVTFSLPDIVDGDNVPICIQGEYYVEVAQSSITARAPFNIAVMTVDEVKASFCLGLPLFASEVLTPVKQPSLITGVTITRVSDRTRPGLKALTYKQADNTLTFDGGPAVTLDGTTEILPGAKGDYIEVNIDSFDLPVGDAAESVMIDKQIMSNDLIRGEIRKAIDDVQNTILKVFIEPLRIATEPFFSAPAEGEWFDFKAVPLTYYRQDFNSKGLAWHLQLPYQQLLKVEKVCGYIGDTKSLQINTGAFSPCKKTGTVDILPLNSQFSYFYTFLVQLNYWGYREYIANFWRYVATAGIERLEGDVLKLIGYMAAIPILTKAGIAVRGGMASESNSKDGVSRSVSFDKAAYASAVTEYQKWIDGNKKSLANRYRGISMVVVQMAINVAAADSFTEDEGEVVRHLVGMRCWCIGGDGQPDPNCNQHELGGYLYVDEKQITGLVTSISYQKDLRESGIFAPGDCIFSPTSDITVSEMDKIIFTWPEVYGPGDPLVRGRDNFDQLYYEAVKAIFCIDENRVRYFEGTDFRFNGKTIEWQWDGKPTAGKQPAIDIRYTIKYKGYLEWIAFVPPMTRISVGVDMGNKVFLRKKHMWEAV